MNRILSNILRSEILGSGPQVLDLVLDLDLASGSGPGSGPRLVPRPTLRISYLIYTGFKGLVLASDYLSLDGPRIG